MADEAKRAIIMGMCPVELERHLMVNPERSDNTPKPSPPSGITWSRYAARVIRWASATWFSLHQHDGEWEQTHMSERAKWNGKGKGKESPRHRVGTWQELRPAGRQGPIERDTGARRFRSHSIHIS